MKLSSSKLQEKRLKMTLPGLEMSWPRLPRQDTHMLWNRSGKTAKCKCCKTISRFGFCVLNFLSILSNFFLREKLTQKMTSVKSWAICKTSILDQNTNFVKWLFLYKFYKLFTIAQHLGLLIFVSVSLVRANLRELRENLKHKIRL